MQTQNNLERLFKGYMLKDGAYYQAFITIYSRDDGYGYYYTAIILGQK